MKNQRKTIQYTALLLSAVYLFAFTGCQRQPVQPNTPTGENSDISSVVDSSFLSSQATESEAVPSMEEPSASSQERSSTEKPPVSSKEPPFPSSQPVVSEPSQSETPTIPFTLGLCQHAYTFQDTVPLNDSNPMSDRFGAKIIQNLSELKELFSYEKNSLSSDYLNYGEQFVASIDYTSKYTEEFFNHHAVVFITIYHPTSSTIYDQVNSLIRSGNQLVVDYTTIHPMIQTDDSGGRHILLEVKKSEISDITEIVPQPQEKELKMGEKYDTGDWK